MNSNFKKGAIYHSLDGKKSIRVVAIDETNNTIGCKLEGKKRVVWLPVSNNGISQRAKMNNHVFAAWNIDNLNELRREGIAASLGKELNNRHV